MKKLFEDNGALRKLWTLEGAAIELGLTKPVLARRILNLPPDQTKKMETGSVRRYWYLATIISHLQGNDPQSGPRTRPLAEERARLASEQADKASLANAVRRGELLEVQHVAAAWSDVFITLKTKILALPSKLAVELSTLVDADEVRNRLSFEVRQLLEEASQFDPLKTDADSDSEFDDDDEEPAETPTRLNGQRVGGRAQKAQPRKQRRARPVED